MALDKLAPSLWTPDARRLDEDDVNDGDDEGRSLPRHTPRAHGDVLIC